MLYDMMPATFSEFRSYPFPDSKEGKEGKDRSVVEAGKEDNEGMIWKEFFSPFFSGRFVKKFELVKFFIFFFTFYGQKEFLLNSRSSMSDLQRYPLKPLSDQERERCNVFFSILKKSDKF